MGEDVSDLELITQTVQLYFDGLYYRDLERLRKAFHSNAYLFGYLRGQPVHVSAEDWFKLVETRPVPAESGEEYDMRIVSTDVTGAVAVVINKAVNIIKLVKAKAILFFIVSVLLSFFPMSPEKSE